MAAESPVLLLSQDYELFFHRSGSVEKCLFEPCDALLGTADTLGLKITFFVDAGMILSMRRHALATADRVSKHVASLAAAGHEIALHIHPHWEDTRLVDGAWDFSSTRFQLRDFSDGEAAEIVASYANCLGDIAGQSPVSYRAGGFCVEPFAKIRTALLDAGINIDSSVVPGAWVSGADKGFDFRAAPTDDEWWFFDESPLLPKAGGAFLELPIPTQILPRYYYWKLIPAKVLKRPADNFGDGFARKPGSKEIFRRLAGLSRRAELSIDYAQVDYLLTSRNLRRGRKILQLMGHPKMLSRHSLEVLKDYVAKTGIRRFETVASVGALLRSKTLA